MIAKEIAREIVIKMQFQKEPLMFEQAKQCALIAINEIIKALEEYDERTEKNLKKEFPDYLSFELQNMEQDFRLYEKVKQETEKL